MFNFFKKNNGLESPKEEEKHYICDPQHIEALYGLLDEIDDDNNSKITRYRFWVKIRNIFPDLDISGSSWRFNCSDILNPYIYKI